jgi:acyl-[acyl-carrier-protein]-phospholipid O-acyltransferase/long-chain-fatty-acid--[acyl-carrier-protein] ligase
VLFTSGSEGTPKGVVLSHANLLANRYQISARVDFNPTDIVFNALPVFHSFGLTGGTLLPILSGVKTFLYPSPLHFRIVPALVYDTNATIMFGTDTFLAGYARVAHPYDFYSVRYVFAGAEKIREETRRIWADKFGLRILEGYGATETSPILSTNTPIHFKAGTVGRFLPGIEHRLEPVAGIDEGGKLLVSGANVMLGYLRAEKSGVLEPPIDGRYDTGDIVSVDAEGFVTIQGRVKRFAKIAGEMVSLSAIEGYANAVWPGHMHVVVAIPDARKGEQLVLVTDKPDAHRDDFLTYAKGQGIAELMVPKTIHTFEEIPVLSSGKVNYPEIMASLQSLSTTFCSP